MSVRVQAILSDEEFRILSHRVSERGITISKYIKDCLNLENNNQSADEQSRFDEPGEFERLWNEFEDKLHHFPAGIEFHMAMVMSQDRWNELSRSSKLSLAKLFNKKVKDKTLKENIEIVGRSSANVTLYKIIK